MQNTIMMVVDSLRADHVTPKLTPNLDAFASEGAAYKNAFSMGSNTIDSYPSIIGRRFIRRLKRRGYIPVLIHSNVNLTLAKLPLIEIDLGKEKMSFFQRGILPLVLGQLHAPYRRARRINEAALRIIPELPKPFFVVLWYMDVHLPYIPPKTHRDLGLLKTLWLNYKLRKAILSENVSRISPDDVEDLKRLYAGEVAFFDQCFGAFMKSLDDVEDLCLILLADHGEEFTEYGFLGHHQHKPIPPLRHVPLIIKAPNIRPRTIEDRFTFYGLDDIILSVLV